MRAEDLRIGQRIKYTITGKEFDIARVTDKRISWYVGFIYPSSYKKMSMRMAWVSIKQFQKGLDSGMYVIL